MKSLFGIGAWISGLSRGCFQWQEKLNSQLKAVLWSILRNQSRKFLELDANTGASVTIFIITSASSIACESDLSLTNDNVCDEHLLCHIEIEA